MTKTTLSLLFVAIFQCAAIHTIAQNKFACISFNELVNAMPETKKADTTLAQYQAALQQQFETMKTDYSAQVRSLKGTSLNAEKLADAIQAGQTAGVSSILAAFDRAAVSNQTLGAQRAEIAAVRAYDTQTEKVNELAAQAEVARQRLAASLP